MVSAEPHLYLTMPSLRIWLKSNRTLATWTVALAAAAVVALAFAVIAILG